MEPVLTVPELDAVRRHEFPLTAECIYLNNAASAPLPQRTAETLRQYSHDRQKLYPLYQTGTQDFDTGVLRESLGSLLNCSAAEIAFAPSTTDAIALTLNAIDWRPGENVVLSEDEFPGIVYACTNLSLREGIEARTVPTCDGHIDIDSLIGSIDAKTRAVVVSHVHWTSGYKCDIAAIGKACRERGILFIVDAIQSVGALEVDAKSAYIDVLAAGTPKWLLGIPGTAVLFVDSNVIERLMPDRAGWIGVKTSAFEGINFCLYEDTRRFMVGTPCDPALMALKQSLDLLTEAGIPNIQTHVLGLADMIFEGAEGAGLTITSTRNTETRSGIVNVTTGSLEGDKRLVTKLAAERIIVAPRGAGIRVSPHLYNNAADISAFLAACGRLRVG